MSRVRHFGSATMSQEHEQRFGLSTRGKVLVIVLVLGVSWLWYAWPKTTVEGVKQELQEHAPVGTPRAQVEAWLKQKQIEYIYSQDFCSDSTLNKECIIINNYSGYIVAIIRNASRDLLVTCDICVYLVFDKQDQITRYTVHHECTGP
jgi:hypothetical protein